MGWLSIACFYHTLAWRRFTVQSTLWQQNVPNWPVKRQVHSNLVSFLGDFLQKTRLFCTYLSGSSDY